MSKGLRATGRDLHWEKTLNEAGQLHMVYIDIIRTHPRLVEGLLLVPLTFIHKRPANIPSLMAGESDLCNTIAECYLKLPPSKMLYAAVSLFSGATLVSLEDTVRH